MSQRLQGPGYRPPDMRHSRIVVELHATPNQFHAEIAPPQSVLAQVEAPSSP
ncbi:MAG: hypothetical protein JSU95_10290 [Betaproteobacteria bacterium]|nr:MAG: hypothetical protein JSU95_10290 [Betaproteobacteria bacterium]